MKKPAMAVLAAIITLTMVSCATAGSGQAGGGVTLQDAIGQFAQKLATDLPQGTRVAIAAFDSESEILSGFIIGELTTALFGTGLEIVDRRHVAIVQQELDFQLSGYVSDETARGIGHFLGAEFVVTGQLLDLGPVQRISVTAIHVETAAPASAPRLDVRNDRALQEMIATLAARPPTEAVARDERDNIAAEARLARALSYLDQGDNEASIMEFTAALRLNPYLLAAYHNRGRAHFRLGVYPQAVADLTEAIRLSPDHFFPLYQRGLAHHSRAHLRQDRGDLYRAVADMEAALRINSDLAGAWSTLNSARSALNFIF